MAWISKLTLVMIINFTSSFLYSMEKNGHTQALEDSLEQIRFALERVNRVHEGTDRIVFRGNEAMALAHSSNATSIDAYKRATQALHDAGAALKSAQEAAEIIKKVQALPVQIEERAKASMTNLEKESDRLKAGLLDFLKHQGVLNIEDRIKIEKAKIDEKQRQGIFEQEERIKAQGSVDVENAKWKNFRQIIDDPKRIIKIVLAVLVIAFGIYAAKHGIPILMNCLTQPTVVSETSRTGWLGKSDRESVNLSDLIFSPSLEKQLFDLVLRVQTAKIYNENLPNVLFYGASGTGKTAFVRALAYSSGLDYALTSGSEFAKITDLNVANNELRKLLQWAQNDDKGLIVFIDEAESLFANRRLPTTPKMVQDFINTFLALVSDKSQKNVMFVFATNHPFKLDDAMTDRIGINIEFTLPEGLEREKILSLYLDKFAKENKNAVVDISAKVIEKLPQMAKNLKGFSPRALKFIAEEMIIHARRQEQHLLTHDIAQDVLCAAKKSLQKTEEWKLERDKWVKSFIT